MALIGMKISFRSASVVVGSDWMDLSSKVGFIYDYINYISSQKFYFHFPNFASLISTINGEVECGFHPRDGGVLTRTQEGAACGGTGIAVARARAAGAHALATSA